MPKRYGNKRPADMNRLAFAVVREAVGDANKLEPETVASAEEVARKGGLARAEKLSKKRRVEIARKAAQARWESD